MGWEKLIPKEEKKYRKSQGKGTLSLRYKWEERGQGDNQGMWETKYD